MADKQGWTQADFHCGRCSHKFTATTEEEYVRLYAGHKACCPATVLQQGQANVLREIASASEAMAKGRPRMTVRQMVAELRELADRIEAS